MTIPEPPRFSDLGEHHRNRDHEHRGIDGPLVRLVVLLAMLALIAVAVAISGLDSTGEWLHEAAESPWGVVGFVLLYIVLVVLLVPGSLGTIAAGAVFGMWIGAAAALTGATIGASIAFAISRRVGREGASTLITGRVKGLDRWLSERGLVAMIVLRLLPVVPFNALNYAAGLSSIRPRHYLVGTAFGMIPGTLVVTAVADQADDPTSAGFATALGTAVVALIASIYAANRVRQLIADA
ncbi:MAG: TVP38/TMEM64 family protein [Acidimicrobiales bacterium]|nr:TVP38/TMEM64 family protein [Acidimicrobiales bacterium]